MSEDAMSLAQMLVGALLVWRMLDSANRMCVRSHHGIRALVIALGVCGLALMCAPLYPSEVTDWVKLATIGAFVAYHCIDRRKLHTQRSAQ